MPLRAVTCLLALATALGALLAGHVWILPQLAAPSPLADANLAHALAAPLALRVAELATLGAAMLWLACARGWPRGALTTLSATALVACGLDRLWLIPRMHEAAGLVDLVTEAPATHMATLARAELAHQLTVTSACVLLGACAFVLARHLEDARVRALATGHAEVEAQRSAASVTTLGEVPDTAVAA